MLVYRLEYEDGKGIYNGSLGFIVNRQAMEQVSQSEYVHPGPEHDAGLTKWWEGPGKNWSKKKAEWHYRGRTEYVCGFADEGQMLEWFPSAGFALMLEEISKDQAEGWPAKAPYVAVYKVVGNKVRKGTHQVMFRKEDAELVEARSLAHYSG